MRELTEFKLPFRFFFLRFDIQLDSMLCVQTALCSRYA